MRAIAFLGTGNYVATTYTFGEQAHTTPYCPVAVSRFFAASELVLLLTEKAERMHLEGLRRELTAAQPSVALRPVRIPEGRNEAEMWQLFDALSSACQDAPGQSVLLDVTHSYRSLPLLAIIAVAFLRVASSLAVERVVYGAWEARDDANRTPVLDLTPFLTLLDWTTATDQFLRTGNAKVLAKLLEAAHALPYRQGVGSAELPQRLSGVASALRDVSLAMQLMRVHDVLRNAARLVQRLEQVGPEVQRWAPPFGVLLDRTKQGYQSLALPNPDENSPQSLRRQLDLLDWYVDKERSLEALLLAREWIVSRETQRQGASLHDVAERERVEARLNENARRWREDRSLATGTEAELLRTWNELADLRNDVAHAGMRPNPASAQTVVTRIKTVGQRMQALLPPD